ncbi:MULTISPECIES: PqiC family protein [Actibacterium]|uniref:ABC-type transport auxiliary lipoprotein component domain-containing protein n=1 Tax=Actibacterium naphthalenivorans TaxID=1614693 RepID=A0A840C9M6_9RHOB|nr:MULTISPECIES: ABC-type transport auxiliary lipoprotein family protein [Actibacterium]ALG91342.1 hypothetical protein TQ29_15520 [Actibacterium sp. EMB200-NS6]MBB4022744.1 hypothetical protein [Actibacterium naphthalenivorans]
MSPLRALAVALVLLLPACSATGPGYQMEPVTSDLRVRPAVRSVVVRTVSLPAYAAADEIALQSATGAIETPGGLWADTPERAATLVIARHLAEITSATVAAEPWPLDALPDVSVDIRAERLLAGADGVLRLSGMYYVSGEGRPFDNTAGRFDIPVPLEGATPGAIAAAQANALRQLSETIARALAAR